MHSRCAGAGASASAGAGAGAGAGGSGGGGEGGGEGGGATGLRAVALSPLPFSPLLLLLLAHVLLGSLAIVTTSAASSPTSPASSLLLNRIKNGPAAPRAPASLSPLADALASPRNPIPINNIARESHSGPLFVHPFLSTLDPIDTSNATFPPFAVAWYGTTPGYVWDGDMDAQGNAVLAHEGGLSYFRAPNGSLARTLTGRLNATYVSVAIDSTGSTISAFDRSNCIIDRFQVNTWFQLRSIPFVACPSSFTNYLVAHTSRLPLLYVGANNVSAPPSASSNYTLYVYNVSDSASGSSALVPTTIITLPFVADPYSLWNLFVDASSRIHVLTSSTLATLSADGALLSASANLSLASASFLIDADGFSYYYLVDPTSDSLNLTKNYPLTSGGASVSSTLVNTSDVLLGVDPATNELIGYQAVNRLDHYQASDLSLLRSVPVRPAGWTLLPVGALTSGGGGGGSGDDMLLLTSTNALYTMTASGEIVDMIPCTQAANVQQAFYDDADGSTYWISPNADSGTASVIQVHPNGTAVLLFDWGEAANIGMNVASNGTFALVSSQSQRIVIVDRTGAVLSTTNTGLVAAYLAPSIAVDRLNNDTMLVLDCNNGSVVAVARNGSLVARLPYVTGFLCGSINMVPDQSGSYLLSGYSAAGVMFAVYARNGTLLRAYATALPLQSTTYEQLAPSVITANGTIYTSGGAGIYVLLTNECKPGFYCEGDAVSAQPCPAGFTCPTPQFQYAPLVIEGEPLDLQEGPEAHDGEGVVDI